MTPIATILSLVLFCPLPQDAGSAVPDLSSPEKAAKAWAEFWLNMQHRSNPFIEVMGKAEDTTLPALTPAAAEKHKERAKKQSEMFKGNETLSWKTKVAAIEDGEGGLKEVTLEVTRTFNKKDWRTKKVNEVTETKPHKYLFKQVGQKWLLKQIFNPCYSCKGKGVCGSCKGSGQRAGGSGPCFRCNGNKGCEQCKGKKYREEKLAKVGMKFIKASVKVEVKEDYSTPQNAAKSWMQLERKKELVGSHLLGGWIQKTLKKMRQYLVPELVKEIDSNIAKGEEAGTKRFLEKKSTLKSVEEEQDGTAYAVIGVPIGGGMFGPVEVAPGGKKKKGPTEQLKRLVLKKTGDKWLVDEIQRACSSCNSKGDCGKCKGKANPNGRACWSCQDTNKCRWCKGAGWRSSNF